VDDNYIPSLLTIDYLIRMERPACRKNNGWNRSACQARIDFMMDAAECCLIPDHQVTRARRTINNLEKQLEWF